MPDHRCGAHPIGRYAGALSSVRADDLAAVPLKALMRATPNWTGSR
jgi:acetyl-CoA acyltransferase